MCQNPGWDCSLHDSRSPPADLPFQNCLTAYIVKIRLNPPPRRPALILSDDCSFAPPFALPTHSTHTLRNPSQIIIVVVHISKRGSIPSSIKIEHVQHLIQGRFFGSVAMSQVTFIPRMPCLDCRTRDHTRL